MSLLRSCCVALAFLVFATDAAPTEQERPAHVLSEPVSSSVQLFARREAGRRAGSAVVIAVDEARGRSLVLTAAHLVTPPAEQTIEVGIPFANDALSADVLAVDAERDVALIEIDSARVTPVRMQSEVWLGDGVWVVAFPLGHRRIVSRGIVSQLALGPEGDENLVFGTAALIDVPVTPGMSGGGVFDAASGGMIGLVRGYRTARIRVPGADDARAVVPIAGETMVTATPDIRDFLATISPLDAWGDLGALVY